MEHQRIRISKQASKHEYLTHGFTLIELLVVIAIIMLLVAVLMPSLAKSRDLARTAACQTNLRSCGLSLGMYASDCGDYPLEGPPGLGDWHLETMIAMKMISRDQWKCTGTTGDHGMWGAPWQGKPSNTEYKDWKEYAVFMYRGPWAPLKKDDAGNVTNQGGFADGQSPGNTKVDAFFGSLTMVNSYLAGYNQYIYNDKTCPSYRYPQWRMLQMACGESRYFGNAIYGLPRTAATWAYLGHGVPIPGNVTSTAAVHNGQAGENFLWTDGSVQGVTYAPGDYWERQQARDKSVYAWAKVKL
ncbi:MAG: type II secretion system GspH family protein [Phycisphaerae bacterium]|nr:type II secretion system GspH family protein [Phycisphaerae bacterium]